MKLPDGSIQCDGETCCQKRQPCDETWFIAWEAAGTYYQKLWNEELALWPSPTTTSMVKHLCSLRCASQCHDIWMQVQIRRQRLFHRNGMELIRERAR